MDTGPFTRILISWILILSTCYQVQSEPCTLPSSKPGTCVAIQRCRNIYNLVKNPSPQYNKFAPYINKAACTLPGVTRSICCQPAEIVPEPTINPRVRISGTSCPSAATDSKQDLLPKDCGKTFIERISNGNVTKVFAYPWMAVLQYIDENGSIVDKCAGSLISERYVLTAAHCIKTRSSFQLHQVILGEHTKNQDVDCNIYKDNKGNEIERDCAEPIEKFGVESAEIHQDYNRPKFSNDIGLIRLDRDVTVADHIQPICLPLTAEQQTQTFDSYIVTGWGTTEAASGSDVLLEAILRPIDRSKCQQEMKKNRLNIELSDKQMCSLGEGLVDTCKGDSGGPLITSVSYNGARYMQFGIVSTGINSCGQRNVPGVYCRVASYIDWILDHIEPSC